jgi:hypothetical protein
MIRPNIFLDWPLLVIDFEASALSTESYPIEVGIAILNDPASTMEIWSTLIKPVPHWDMKAQWDPDAERIHGISRWSLRDGRSPREAMIELNRRIPIGAKVWCDGGYYDLCWLKVLATAAETAPAFELYDLSDTLRRNGALCNRYLTALNSVPPPHRAGPDAERICRALLQEVNS